MTNSDGVYYDRFWEHDYVPPYQEPLFPVFTQLGILPGAKVLDVGCGNGTLGEYLIRTFQCEMYGTDVSPVALKAAQARGYWIKQIEPDSYDVSTPPFPDTKFDIVVLSAVIEHIFDPTKLLNQCYSSLKDGGYLVLLTPNVTWFLNRLLFAADIWDHPLLGGTPGHIRYLNQRMLEKLLLDVGFRSLDWTFSSMLVLPSDHDLFVGERPLRFLRPLVGKRAVRWQSLLAENFIVLARKPASTFDSNQLARLDPVQHVKGLRVLHIAGTASGAHWMYDMLRLLRTRGYNVSAMISGAQGNLAGKLEQAGIPYFVGDLEAFSGSSPFKMVRQIFKLCAFLREQRFDIVHYHLFGSIILGRFAAWIADVPLRFSMNTGPYYLEAPMPREYDIKTARMDSKVIASCDYTRQLYLSWNIPSHKVERIYYGADPSNFDPDKADPAKLRRELGIPRDAPVVGMVAYFYPPLPPGPWTPPYLYNRAIKGHETLIYAAEIVRRHKPNAKVLLIGAGWGSAGKEYEKTLRQLVEQMELSDTVIFTGARQDIPNVLSALDVSVQHSRCENLGGTIESLFMARPTVATAVGGMVDSVRDRETGLLVPPDDPQRLAEAILEMLDHPDLAQQWGINGRSLMLRDFTLAKTVDDVDQLYQSEVRRFVNKRKPATLPHAYRYRLAFMLMHLITLSIVGSGLLIWNELKLGALSLKQNWKVFLAQKWKQFVLDAFPILAMVLIGAWILPEPWRWMFLAILGLALILYRVVYMGSTSILLRLLTKRVFDVIVAIVFLVVFSPFVFAAVRNARRRSNESALIQQGRAGRFGLRFGMYSFRTTAQQNETANGWRHFLWLPQIINVLRGEMSWVGVRPTLVTQIEQYDSRQRRVLQGKPGIVNWAMAKGKYNLSETEQIEYDLWYIDHWSVYVDFMILLRIVWQWVFLSRATPIADNKGSEK